MRKPPFPRLFLVSCALAAAFLVASLGAQQEKFTGFAINTNSGPKTATVDFTVTRWSTDAEREQLLAIIKENKDPTDKLLKALQKMPKVGYIKTPDTLAYDVHYAHRVPDANGGERIVLVTDRRLGAHAPDWAPASGGAADAEFTLIEMRVDAKGVGEGKASLTTNVVVDAAAKTLALDGYEAAPLLLKVSR